MTQRPRHRRRPIPVALLLAVASPVLGTSVAEAKPNGPQILCETYPEAPACAGGVPDCRFCHVDSGPPARNAFGLCLESSLLPGEPRPLSDMAFSSALPEALAAVAEDDCDGDSVGNLDEILAGSDAADPASFPEDADCPGLPNPDYAVCELDPRYLFRKLHLDFCGHSPTYAALEAFLALGDDAQRDTLHEALDTCLDSEFWRGRDGEVWRLAHPKVRPISGLKGGAIDRGSLPVFGDYYDDYALFVYAHTDDRDARQALTADYFVEWSEHEGVTTYWPVDETWTVNCGLDFECIVSSATAKQLVPAERRAGLLTTRWNLVANTMFTDVPRTTAAQAYRAYLGLDIAKMEGLEPVGGEPIDYDDKGVDQPACATCHSTLDPLTYPFSRYNGFGFTGLFEEVATYVPDRMAERGLADVPEEGILFGQPVADLVEWAEVAADSDAFARATVLDYWRLAHGEEPTDDEVEELASLSDRFANTHEYRVERMLHDLIETEAYHAP